MELTKDLPSSFTGRAGSVPLGGIYPLSVTQGYQSGEIYELGRCAVIHHYCGFAFLLGEPTQKELEILYDNMLRDRRFVLFCSDERQLAFFNCKEDISTGTRCFYEYGGSEPKTAALPSGFSVRVLDEELIMRLGGRIVPSFSWKDNKEFLKGRGYCIMDGDTPAAWAFSAAVSDSELDIGVETAEPYRGKGLAGIAGGEMIRYALSIGRKPVWACDSRNTASARTAEKLGFAKIGECSTVIRTK